MKNKKIITMFATLGLITCLYSKVNAVNFYDTFGTRYEGAVERLHRLDVLDGVSQNVFNAQKKVTRAEFAKMITKTVLNVNEFNALAIDASNCQYKDVSVNDWFYKYVVVATNYGLLSGYEDGTFRPEKEVTYEEIAKMVMKGLGHTYLREDHPDGWATEYMLKMYEYDLTDDTEAFKKNEGATRGNVAIILWNALTTNTWEKIYLNDTHGFTYVDSGLPLFSNVFSKIRNHEYNFFKKVEIKDIREINGKLNVRIGNSYYRVEDEESVIKMSMLGGKAEALTYIVRNNDEKKTIKEIILVGLSSDVDTTMYEGTLDELNEDGFKINGKDVHRLGSNGKYGYLIYDNIENDIDRVVTFNSEGKRFLVEKVNINEEKETIELGDIDNDGKDDTEEIITKTITINEDAYTINDGAVLFHNNKRVNWKSLKEGDVLTEVVKDKYYIMTRKKIEVRVDEFEKDSNCYILKSSEGEFISYPETQCIEYLSVDSKRLNSISINKLAEMKGKNARLTLDFAGKIIKIEFLDSYSEKDLINVGIGYYYSMAYAVDSSGYSMLTVMIDGRKKVYRTTLKSADVSLGDLVTLEINENNVVTGMKKIDNSAEINKKLEVKTLTYRNIMDRIEDEEIAENTIVYKTVYEYDFGDYEQITDFNMTRVDLKEFESINEKNTKILAVMDEKEEIIMLLIQDFSEKRDVYYGKVKILYRDDDGNIRMVVSVLGGGKEDFKVSGLLNCEEGDIISFKMLDEQIVKVVERDSPKALGYYKDIKVKRVRNKNVIETEYGTLDLSKNKLIIEDKECLLSEYVFIFTTVSKNQEGEWEFNQAKYVEKDELTLEANDMIAIDEIENTFIIYRGYSE